MFQALHFTDSEILRGKIVPLNLIQNIFPTLKVLDYLREDYRKPIYIVSGYRSPAYNRSVGGAKHSMHMEFNALDFTVKEKADLYSLYLLLIEYDAQHFFKFLPKPGSMGIGYYEGRFIHLDTRATLGRTAPARWKG